MRSKTVEGLVFKKIYSNCYLCPRQPLALVQYYRSTIHIFTKAKSRCFLYFWNQQNARDIVLYSSYQLQGGEGGEWEMS